MKGRLLIYVSGKLEDKTEKAKEDNVIVAIKYGNKLIDKGHLIYIPHFSQLLDRLQPRKDFWLGYDLQILVACDAIFMLPNWKDSKGAILENTRAREWGKKIFENLDEVYTTNGGIWS